MNILRRIKQEVLKVFRVSKPEEESIKDENNNLLNLKIFQLYLDQPEYAILGGEKFSI